MFQRDTVFCVLVIFISSVSAQLIADLHPADADIQPTTIFPDSLEKYPLLDFLDKSVVQDTPEYKAEEVLKNEIICDIEKLVSHGNRSYLPSICTSPNDCQTARGSEVFLDSSCSKNQMCCRVDRVKHLSDTVFTPLLEIPHTYNLAPTLSYTGQFQFTPPPNTPETSLREAWDISTYNLTLMNLFPVCAMRRVSPNNFRYNLFFCVGEEHCQKPKKYPGEQQFIEFDDVVKTRVKEAWNTICENVARRHLYPARNDSKRVCCDSNLISQIHHKSDIEPYFYNPFNFVPQIPLFLKYARGFRASYMCEHYARVLCDENIETCEDYCPIELKRGDTLENLYEKWMTEGDEFPGDIPHQALIGTYSQKFLLYFYCGGSLISRRWILSSKRCQSFHGMEANIVLLGMYDTSAPITKKSEEKLYLISQILPYPYDGDLSKLEGGTSNLYDYGLYKTHKEVEFSKYIRPACIYHTDPPLSFKQMFFTGYGFSTLLGDQKSTFVKKIPMLEVFRSDGDIERWKSNCAAHFYYEEDDKFYGHYGVKENHMICTRTYLNLRPNQTVPARSSDGAPCKYDEGGPLQFKVPLPSCIFEIYAVLSSKRMECVKADEASAFQTVKDFVHHIEDIVWKYPFLEDIERPVLQSNQIQTDLLWYDECEDLDRCPIDERTNDVEDFHKEPPNLFDDYDIPFVSDLNSGITPKIFDETTLLTSQETLCDMERYGATELKFTYAPSFCVKNGVTSCTGPSKIQAYKSGTCDKVNSQYVCCPAPNMVRFRDATGNNLSTYAHREPLNYKFNKDVVLTGVGQSKTFQEDYDIIVEHHDQQTIEKEFVCGIKTVFYKENHEFEYTPFFCTKPSNCIRDVGSDYNKRTPLERWKDFCRARPGMPKALKGKTECCHPRDIANSQFPTNFPWELNQMPLYLKYAPGMRAAFKCEEYSKFLCEQDQNKCVRHDASTLSAERGEIPHVAQIGFIVPKFMLFYCSGSIVSTRYILSTVACSFKYGIVANTVLVGNFDTQELIDTPGWEKLYILAEILPHPFVRNAGTSTDPNNPDTLTMLMNLLNVEQQAKFVDLALYRTSEDIHFSPRVRPVCIYYNLLKQPDEALFTGFGLRKDPGEPHEIKKVLIILEGNDANQKSQRVSCNKPELFDAATDPYYAKFGVNEPYMFCGKNDNPENAPCKYDNGGPLQLWLHDPTCSWQLIGVLSSATANCDKPRPSVFIKTNKFLTQLEDAIWPLPFLDLDIEKPPCLTPYETNFLYMFYTLAIDGKKEVGSTVNKVFDR